MTAIAASGGARFTGDQRRRVASGHAMKVPLVTAVAKGDLIEGKIVVPKRLAWAEPDTNAKHEFDNLVREHIDRWVEWRAKRGWAIASFPNVRGPFDPPTRTEKDEPDPDVFWYFVIARFVRTEPLWASLEDVLHINEQAARYGVDVTADHLPWNVPDEPDTGWGNPLEIAEARRQKYGLKKADLLFGPLEVARGMTPPSSAGVNLL